MGVELRLRLTAYALQYVHISARDANGETVQRANTGKIQAKCLKAHTQQVKMPQINYYSQGQD